MSKIKYVLWIVVYGHTFLLIIHWHVINQHQKYQLSHKLCIAHDKEYYRWGTHWHPEQEKMGFLNT